MRSRLIAEVASNHGGDVVLAREFVHAAAECGADYVKFQSWRAATVRQGDAQAEWLNRAELSDDAHVLLLNECRFRGVGFLTTCFDVNRIEFLASLGLQTIKVGSADLGSRRMLLALRGRFPHVIVSAGLAKDDEVIQAAAWLQGGEATILHCVSEYPTPPDRANLRRMLWFRTHFSHVGWSDHVVGIDVAKAAIAAGAEYVEKHFCLGRNGPGRAMPWDATPQEFTALAHYAADVESMMGNAHPALSNGQAEGRIRYIGRFGDNR